MTAPIARVFDRVTVIAAAFWSILLCASGCETSSDTLPTTKVSPRPTRAMLLKCSPEGTVRLGVVRPGGTKQAVFWLTNHSGAPVEFREIKVSCECLKIILPIRRIWTNERMAGDIVLDLAAEPESQGQLAIEVEALTANGETAFALTVDVEVAEPGNPTGG